MVAASFNESNCVLGPPKGTSEGEPVYSLSIYRGIRPDNLPVCISCWKLTKEELEEINRTGRVWLHVIGETMPPVALETSHPFMA